MSMTSEEFEEYRRQFQKIDDPLAGLTIAYEDWSPPDHAPVEADPATLAATCTCGETVPLEDQDAHFSR
jgi:hypothetical protein